MHSALQTNTRRHTGNSTEYQPLQQANVLCVLCREFTVDPTLRIRHPADQSSFGRCCRYSQESQWRFELRASLLDSVDLRHPRKCQFWSRSNDFRTMKQPTMSSVLCQGIVSRMTRFFRNFYWVIKMNWIQTEIVDNVLFSFKPPLTRHPSVHFIKWSDKRPGFVGDCELQFCVHAHSYNTRTYKLAIAHSHKHARTGQWGTLAQHTYISLSQQLTKSIRERIADYVKNKWKKHAPSFSALFSPRHLYKNMKPIWICVQQIHMLVCSTHSSAKMVRINVSIQTRSIEHRTWK